MALTGHGTVSKI